MRPFKHGFAAALVGALAGFGRWALPQIMAGSWLHPRPVALRHGAKTGIAAARRSARKARSKRRAKHAQRR